MLMRWCAGHLVEGMPFHKFYFDLAKQGRPSGVPPNTTISSPKVTVLGGGTVGIVVYIRLIQVDPSPSPLSCTCHPLHHRAMLLHPMHSPIYPIIVLIVMFIIIIMCGYLLDNSLTDSQKADEEGKPTTVAFEETRVWQKSAEGGWLHVHFHRS